jgi:DNA repair exonuclease SbcCD nuclease subunit
MDNRLVIVGVSVVLSALLATVYFTIESVTNTYKEQLELANAKNNNLSIDNKSLKEDINLKAREMNDTLKEKDKEIRALSNELNLTIEPKPLPKDNIFQYGA